MRFQGHQLSCFEFPDTRTMEPRPARASLSPRAGVATMCVRIRVTGGAVDGYLRELRGMEASARVRREQSIAELGRPSHHDETLDTIWDHMVAQLARGLWSPRLMSGQNSVKMCQGSFS